MADFDGTPIDNCKTLYIASENTIINDNTRNGSIALLLSIPPMKTIAGNDITVRTKLLQFNDTIVSGILEPRFNDLQIA